MRRTEHIKARQASKFFKATRYSQSSPHPLNRHVTINLTHTACPAEATETFQKELNKKFGRWYRYQTQKARAAGGAGYGPPTYTGVVENPNDIHHLHWLVYVPAELEGLFEAVVIKWIDKIAKITEREGLIKIVPIDTVMGLSRYCMKGVDPRHARRCFVRPKPQGTVWGRRVAISRSLGPKARLAAQQAANRACEVGAD